MGLFDVLDDFKPSSKSPLGQVWDAMKFSVSDTFTRTAGALNWTYENAVENPVESLIYKEFMPPNSDPVSWSQAWKLSQDRNIGDTGNLWLNESAQQISDDFGGETGNKLVRSIPFIGAMLGESAGTEEAADIKATDPQAVQKMHEVSPFWFGFTSDVSTFGFSWYADPFALAAKPVKGMREIRAVDPTYRADSAAVARASSASKLYDKILPERAGKWGNNLDDLFGKVAHKPTGKVDDDGVEALEATMTKSGWIDEHTDAEIYVGLGLDQLPASAGQNLATLLGRTRKIENAAERVNARRLIYAAAHGDVNAVSELQALSDSGKEMARVLSNAFGARTTGSLERALVDATKADQIAAGTALRTADEPAVVADAAREVEGQAGYEGWLFASLRDRSLRVTSKGERAVARLRGQGLGRDGTLHSGLRPLDRTVNAALNGFKDPASRVEGALNESAILRQADEIRPDSLAGGSTVSAPSATRQAGFNQMPVTALRGGWKLATAPARVATGITDSIRGMSTPSGALAVEDAFSDTVFKVMKERMRTTGMTPEFQSSRLEKLVHATNPTQRSKAVKEIEAEMIGEVARKHGVTDEVVKELGQHLSRSQDEMVASLNGQRYSAHERAMQVGDDTVRVPGDVIVPGHDGAVYFLDDDGLTVFGLGKGTEATPILSTQTPNFVPLHDVRHADKWLKYDRVLAPGSRVKATIESEDGLIAQTERLGIHRRTESLKSISDSIFRSLDGANGWWKRSVLGLRPVSYALRNTSEEAMRVAAAGHVGVWLDEAVKQGAFKARDFTRELKGGAKWEDAAALQAARTLREQELDTLRSLHADPKVRADVQAAQDMLDAATDPAEREFLESFVLEDAKRLDDMADLEAAIAASDDALTKFPEAARERMLNGIASDAPFPAAFSGQQGTRNSAFLYGHTQLDYETTGAADRLYGHMRGVDPGGIISVDHAAIALDPRVEQRHAAAWGWIVNKQIRQAPEAMVAVNKIADGGSYEDVVASVTEFLRSPKSKRFRAMNPIRSADVDSYAQDIAEMVTHHVPTQNMATALKAGEIDKAKLLEDFKDIAGRPDVHVAGVDSLVGSTARKLEVMTGRWLQTLDKMGPQRFTRHPMFSVFYADEQQRLAAKFYNLRKSELGEGATLSVDDVNRISQRASEHASAQIKRMFYDASVRSTAADRLRLIYPFFAAHQDSMRFWGQTIAKDPVVLRRMQQLFQLPAQVGLVVDYEGNPVKAGTYPGGDHYVLMQMPKNWGGPDPQNPEHGAAGFRVPLSSFNLILQNGSVLNPGAGPMAAIPAGYIQKQIGSSSEDVSRMMTWFNPFGAPKNDESRFGALDPAMPTPVKRLSEMYDAFFQKEGLYNTQLYSVRLQEAQVKFQQENDRVPNKAESKALIKKVADEVKWASMLRFGASLASPSQPQPQSRMQGFIDEYRRLQNKQNEENLGPLWATDKFLETYGDDFIALTKSSSEYRASIDPSYGAVAELKANEKLTNVTDARTWQAIVGAAGEGPFAIDSYRWMQSKVVEKGTGKTLIDKKSPEDRLFDTAVADGWREYNKFMNQLRSTATANGYDTLEQSDQLAELKRAAVKELAEENPSWYEAYSTIPEDYDSTIVPSLERIAGDKRLAGDPARSDVRMIGEYLKVRSAVTEILKQRGVAGGSNNVEAKSNEDVAFAFATIVAKMAQDDTLFSDYAFTGLIEKDPLYLPDVIGAERG